MDSGTSSTDLLNVDSEENFRCELRELLNAISCEMCGDSNSGDQEFLDIQLARYREFLMNYEDKAEQMRGLLPYQLRTHLLLSLQSDVLQLLIEPDDD